MAPNPMVMALANPVPEIMPDLARAERDDAMICTGRSDFPNQVNNVLCFPYIFRGALDCGARTINEEMKMAAVHAIAGLAREEVWEASRTAANGEPLIFGPDYLIPSPFDPAADPEDRACRCPRCRGKRRRRAADPGLPGLL